jgi:hypothetical protein
MGSNNNHQPSALSDLRLRMVQADCSVFHRTEMLSSATTVPGIIPKNGQRWAKLLVRYLPVDKVDSWLPILRPTT